MSILLKIPNIKGNVHIKGYENWIDIIDVDFAGVSNPTKMIVGKAMDRFNTQPCFGQLSLMKHMDESSSKLFEATHSKEIFPQIEIHYVNTGSQLFTYAKTILSNATITYYAEGFSGETSIPEELIRIAYVKIERTFIPQGQDNKAGSPMISGYNLEQAEKL